ncbi:hypothetical protein CRENBAI_008638 [Crenichthys baileyi]|uniref:Uncharacterized protein n=1 Tax=Crenichthys baileyi TaxID=28760 RepID=A0AAV9RUH6_9TELE
MSNSSTNGEEKVNNSSSEDEFNYENSPTTTLMDKGIQENDNKDNQISTENWINTFNSKDEDEGLNAESTTKSKWDVDISQNEEAMSYSEEDLSDAASNEGENHAGDEDVMEGNRTREKTPELSVGSDVQADGVNPLYPAAERRERPRRGGGWREFNKDGGRVSLKNDSQLLEARESLLEGLEI